MGRTISAPRRGGWTAMALVLVLTACSSGASRAKGDGTPHAEEGHASSSAPGNVAIRLVAFNPPTIEVAVGTTVTWTQQDRGAVHTVTSGTVDTDPTGATTPHADGRFDSGQLTEGKVFSFTFSQPGTYPYFCAIHQATMRGEVSVR